MELIKRIALGTAQLGMDYGITNHKGKPSSEEAYQILQSAKNHNIQLLDTAANYGSSEKLIGEFDTDHYFKVSTKIPSLEVNNFFNSASSFIESSLDALQRKKLDYCFLHEPMQLLLDNGNLIWEILIEARKRQAINKIGFSLYDEEQLTILLENSFIPDVIQIPYNLFDRRFAQSRILDHIKDQGTEIHARSIFLQGLLLLEENELPEKFLKYQHLWQDLNALVNAEKFKKLDYLMHFVLQDKRIDKVVIGISSQEELSEMIEGLYQDINFDGNAKQLYCNDVSLLDPRRW